ncbi:Gfo/Idh/MocA family protein [Flexithrix dorotheae]|uniref:Gfo/Idh/MocA family protein n=1 Tax=Flexithrix dorotheae TaxID=70993 RepID=UPI000380056D|nr:Gfo/Idh/MocA family oxidoreductase [Flexithrix dorotheae]
MKQNTNRSNSRRKFIGNSIATMAAFTIVPRYVLGKGFTAPSDKVTLGFIGTGKLSKGLGPRFLKLPNIQMVAASDVNSKKLDFFLNTAKNHYAEVSGKDNFKGIEGYKEYEELINRSDIDAVIVALPDHWHAKASIDAMKAGKDVYCEKPLAHTVWEGRQMVKTARKLGKVVQTGSMQRSSERFLHACELVRNGYIGEIKTVKVNVGDPAIPCDLPGEKVPDNLDWDRWVGPAQFREYSPILAPPITDDVWPKWRDYKEFGGGIFSDWGAHMFDIAQWGLGMDETGPVELIPPKDRTAVRGLVMKYANGIEMIHEDFGRGWAVQFNGTEGKLEVSRSFLETDPANIADKKIGDNEIRLYKSENHYADWINCIKTREKPICDVEIGHRSSSICNIGNIAYQLGRPLKWDPAKEKFDDKEANKLRTKDYRKEYKV